MVKYLSDQLKIKKHDPMPITIYTQCRSEQHHWNVVIKFSLAVSIRQILVNEIRVSEVPLTNIEGSCPLPTRRNRRCEKTDFSHEPRTCTLYNYSTYIRYKARIKSETSSGNIFCEKKKDCFKRVGQRKVSNVFVAPKRTLTL